MKNYSKYNDNSEQQADLSEYVFGKVQPQAVELEQAVLGAIMLDKSAMDIVQDILSIESFYSTSHQEIYKAMQSLYNRFAPIDLLTIQEALKTAGVLDQIGGPMYLIDLTNRIASSANIEYHARIIEQKFVQRKLIEVSTQTIKDSYEDVEDSFVLLDEAEQKLFEISNKSGRGQYKDIAQVLVESQNRLKEIEDRPEGLTGVPTGFTPIDRITGGWQSPDLIIIAARPGMGKTAFTLALAKNAAEINNKGVAVFSLEMSSVQLANRMVSMDSGVEGKKIRDGKLSESEKIKIAQSMERISELPIYIDDTPGINVFELRAKVRRMKMKHDVQMVVVDYLQLMSGINKSGRGNREQEISSISRALKGLAKEFNIPVIALSQLSRAVEVRGGTKRPQLSDLRESGAIEQDADLVSFIYRPEYYQILEDAEGQSLKGVAEIIISKHRNGELGTVKLKFSGEFARFEDPEIDLSNTYFDDIPYENLPEESTYKVKPAKMNDDMDIPF